MSINREVIEIIPNKVLKLTRPLTKDLAQDEMRELNKSLMVIQGAIKARGLNNVGPLITYNSSVIEDGIIRPIVKIITQIQEAPHGKLDATYSFADSLRIENCLYTRFVGEQRYIQIAIMKMQVYAYENYLQLKGDYYTVMLSNDENGMTVDIFMEVIGE